MKPVSEFPAACRSSRTVRLLPLLAALYLPGPAHSAVETFTIDPARSGVTLSGTVQNANLFEQGPGGLATSFAGTIQMDVTPTTVRFPGGSAVVPTEANAWSPGSNGAASYGAKGTFIIGFSSADLVAATRKVAFDLTSATIPRTGDDFDSDGLVLGFSDAAHPVLDYQVTGAFSDSGSVALKGLSTNNAASTSSITRFGGVETVVIPVNFTYSFGLFSSNDVQLNFAGNIVAVHESAVTDPPVVNFTPPSGPAAPLKLAWSSLYKLQRATQLTQPDWADYAEDSPIEIPPTQTGEFFRVVPR